MIKKIYGIDRDIRANDLSQLLDDGFKVMRQNIQELNNKIKGELKFIPCIEGDHAETDLEDKENDPNKQNMKEQSANRTIEYNTTGILAVSSEGV